MEYTRLGNTGLQVSRICLGMMTYGSPEWREWVLPESETRPLVKLAVEKGINFFDTADMYSNGVSEEVTGKLVKEFFPDREDVVIATKCFMGTHNYQRNRFGLSAKHIHAACDASLQRLGVDYIDLYQIHRFDQSTPMEETMDALDALVRAGKVRYLGASSMQSWQFAKYLYLADIHGWHRFVSMQNHYNLLYREEEREMMNLCCEEGIGVIPWSPLARGLLTRSPDVEADSVRGSNDPVRDHFYKLELDVPVARRNFEVAESLGIPPAHTALAWLLSRPGVTSPIIGATKPQHIEDAVSALEVGLSEEQVASLEELYQPHAVSGH